MTIRKMPHTVACSVIALLFVLMMLLYPTSGIAQQGFDAVYNSSGTSIPSAAYVDATQFLGTDLCSTIYNVLNVTTTFIPGEVIDARGVIAAGASPVCAHTPWNNGTTYLSTKASTILLPAGTITIPSSWIIPNNTRVIGIEPGSYHTTPATGTMIQACLSSITGCHGLNFASGTAMLQFGDSNCPQTGTDCTGISVEGVVLNGNGLNIIGIQNSNAQDLSFVDHVTLYKIFGTGLMVSGNAQHSGPYSNVVFDTGTSSAAPTACAQIEGITGGTRGIHGLTCISSTVGQTAVFLDSSNNSLEDIRINGFVDGILVGSNGVAKSNVLINITGDTVPWNQLVQMPIYIVHISNAQTSGQANVSDLAVVGVSNAGGTNTATVLDDLTSTMFGDQVALYVLGESANGGYSRFTTSHNAATWAVGANAPTPSSPCPIGSLYTMTGILNGISGHLYVCTKGSTPTWQLVQ